MDIRHGTIAVLASLVLGCGGDSTAPAQPHTTSVFNFLAVSVQTSAGGTAYGTVQSNASTVLTIPASVSSITITPAKFTFSDGSPIPDDMGAFTMPLVGPSVALDVNNVVNGQAFVLPTIYNGTTATVLIAIADGASVRCISSMGPSSLFGAPLGYFRLTTTVEVRAYRSGSNCSGTFRFWSNAALSTFEAKTGVVNLTLNTAP